MTQRDSDRPVVLKKAAKKLIKQSQAAQELELTARHVRRLRQDLKQKGDKVVIHGLRGKPSQRKSFSTFLRVLQHDGANDIR